MIVTYSPDGQDSQEWSWDPSKVRAAEAEIIEKRFGDSWDRFRGAVLEGSIKARRVLLWSLLKRQHPTLKLDDVDFALSELTVELTKPELLEFRKSVAESGSISDADREKALAVLDQEIAKAVEPEGKAS